MERIAKYWQLALGLRKFLKEPVSLTQSRSVIQENLVDRETNLLALVKRGIYEYEASPYRKLLNMAGCEYGDLKKMILTEGIEWTLRKLCEQGVYLSQEEFAGRVDVVRGPHVFRFKRGDFDNPFLRTHMLAQTSGSRSKGTSVKVDLERYGYFALWMRVMYDVHQLWKSPVIVWMPILPSAARIAKLLWLAKMDNPPVRWLSHIQAKSVKPDLSKRLATWDTVYAARLFGVPMPKPEFVSFSSTTDVAVAMSKELEKGRGCVLETYTNSAVRVCQVAKKEGINLSGGAFVVGGEPLTQTKSDEIRASGGKLISIYAITEMGLMGFSCANPCAVDDVHFFKQAYAVIQRNRKVPGASAPVDAFLFTSILSRSAKVLLNVESGDYGKIEHRDCGCGFQELGLDDHICEIRGFDKLTGEGMSFIGTDLLRIMGSVLPKRFGGASTDYQLVEEEDEGGRTRITLRINPEVGAVDEKELIQLVVDELGKGSDAQRFMARMWSDAGIVKVERVRPVSTDGGKLLPLHIQGREKPKA